jgi:hypothetical protein
VLGRENAMVAEKRKPDLGRPVRAHGAPATLEPGFEPEIYRMPPARKTVKAHVRWKARGPVKAPSYVVDDD